MTPVNDSFVDLDLFEQPVGGDTRRTRLGPYAQLVEEARHQRRALDGGRIDWIVVPNRLSMIQSNNKIKVRDALESLAVKLDFRIAQGVSERVIFREFFPLGVTAFDPLDQETFGVSPSMSHVSARSEMRRLVDAIGLGAHVGFHAKPKAAAPPRPARKRQPAKPKAAVAAAPVAARPAETAGSGVAPAE